ncbi:hypothetical protein D3C85_1258740 [compost metagenome]
MWPGRVRPRRCLSRWGCPRWMPFPARSGHGWARAICAACSRRTLHIPNPRACWRCGRPRRLTCRWRAASNARRRRYSSPRATTTPCSSSCRRCSSSATRSGSKTRAIRPRARCWRRPACRPCRCGWTERAWWWKRASRPSPAPARRWSRPRIRARCACHCRCPGGRRCWTGPSAAARGSLKTTMTANIATSAGPCRP